MKSPAAGSAGTERYASWSGPNMPGFQVAEAAPDELPVAPLLLIVTVPPSCRAGDCQLVPSGPAARAKSSRSPVRGKGSGGGGVALGVADTSLDREPSPIAFTPATR